MRITHPSRTGTALAVALAAAIGVATPAAAEPAQAVPAVAPLDVTGQVTDPDGVLGDQIDEVQSALNELSAQTPYQLFVVYVDSFDGLNGVDWADKTADASDLGVNDLLLAIAYKERRYGISADYGTALSDVDLARVESATAARLRADDWAGAAIVAADTTRELVTEGATTRDARANGSGYGFGPLLATVLFTGVVGMAVWLLRRRRSSTVPGVPGAPDALTTIPTTELERRSDVALVAADNAVRASMEQLRFARAQPGVDARLFTDPLDGVRGQLAAAFAARQGMDLPGAPEAQRRMVFAQISTRCAAMGQALGATSQAVDDVIHLPARTPEVLAETIRRAEEARARVVVTRATLDGLAALWAPTTLSLVADNADLATDLLDSAVETAGRGRAALDAQGPDEAAALARAALSATARAITLLDAIDRADAELARVLPLLDERIDSSASDLAEAGRLRTASPATANDATLWAAVAEGQSATAGARAARALEGETDPLGALVRLTTAQAALGSALAPYRDAGERDRHATALLTVVATQAEATIRNADDVVATRRGAVGPRARIRLAEAERLAGEARALAASDSAAALARALGAATFARQAGNQAAEEAARRNLDRVGTGATPGAERS